jgi:hypothetical protein
MPSDRRHNRSLNMSDDLWNWIHRAYQAVSWARPDKETKADFLERVLSAGLQAVTAEAGVPDCYLPQAATSVPVAPLSPPVPSTPPPSPRIPPPSRVPSGPRLSAEERRQQRAARVLQSAGPPLRPPAIPTAAARPAGEGTS